MKILLLLAALSASSALAQTADPGVTLSSRPGKGMLIGGSITAGLGIVPLAVGLVVAFAPKQRSGGGLFGEPINFGPFIGALAAVFGGAAIVVGVILAIVGARRLSNPRTEALAQPTAEPRLTPPAPKPLPSVGPMVQLAAF